MIDLLRYFNILLSLGMIFFYARLFIAIFFTKSIGQETNTKRTLLLLFGVLFSGSIFQFILYQMLLASLLDNTQTSIILNVGNLLGNMFLVICGYLLLAINKGKL